MFLKISLFSLDRLFLLTRTFSLAKNTDKMAAMKPGSQPTTSRACENFMWVKQNVIGTLLQQKSIVLAQS